MFQMKPSRKNIYMEMLGFPPGMLCQIFGKGTRTAVPLWLRDASEVRLTHTVVFCPSLSETPFDSLTAYLPACLFRFNVHCARSAIEGSVDSRL